MSSNLRQLLIALLILILIGCGNENIPSPYHAIDVSWQHPHANFELLGLDGKPRNLADFKSKVVILFFGYTHCPDVCPTTLADLAQTMRSLGDDARRVQVIFVTLDPERDNPDMLSKFVPAFDSSFIALYGSAPATAQAAQSFGVSYAKQPDKHGGYTLDHSDGIYLLGTQGKPLLLAPYNQSTQLLAEDIRLLLATDR